METVMSNYVAKVSFVYEGIVEIKAVNYNEAKNFIGKYFYMLHGSGKLDPTVSSQVVETETIDYRFPVHPEKIITDIRIQHEIELIEDDFFWWE